MARVRVMYWKEIPVQVQAQDARGQVSRQLDPRFQQAADAIAMFDGSAGTDSYMASWEWGPYSEIKGTAEEAATAVASKYNDKFPRDIIRLVRESHSAQTRLPQAGALDFLVEDKGSGQQTGKRGPELTVIPQKVDDGAKPGVLPRQSILARLASGDILISDGGTGTYLQTRGLEPGGAPELLNATRPELIRQMAKDYFAAGSDLVLTNSFGGTVFRLRMHGLEARVRDLNRLAAEHARSAAPSGKYVVGSVGPSGGMLASLGGDIEETALYDAFSQQMKALEEGGADALVIETQFVLDEARIAIKAAKENTRLPVFSSMTFDKGPRGFFTMAGQTPAAAVKGLIDAGADVVGTNCGNGIDRMLEIAQQMRAATGKFLWVKSNAGIPKHVKGQPPLYPESPEYMAERFEKLARMPVNVLGGCCGTGPEHIRALAQAIRTKSLRATVPAG